MAGQSVLLKCSRCGWKNSRQASSKSMKPCAKCGGHMVFASPLKKEEEEIIILVVAGAILLMGTSIFDHFCWHATLAAV